ncbi:hypothetical protein GPJ56_007602 [Histomonas meleagridis]|uniref:uncharacterized protein n=1 Tax=Histomonas meleagridis TaxID=135588 RepID=UPI003559F499|nr:hypothetical protein GPJ56_007602 [Histomonas meleagridis]KAH0806122.1 hypothetical protein GO595_001135 [Histomonas meleagridis]
MFALLFLCIAKISKTKACANFCSRKFKSSNETKACMIGCTHSIYEKVPKKLLSNATPRYEVTASCRDYCDEHSSEFGNFLAPCKTSCSFYDETVGIDSCDCDSSSSNYDKSCRAGCAYMDNVWKWGGGWK